MSLRIKIPKREPPPPPLPTGPSHDEHSTSMQRKPGKRRIITGSDEEEAYGNSRHSTYQHQAVSEEDDFDLPPRSKRPRVSSDVDAAIEATLDDDDIDVDGISPNAHAHAPPEPGPSRTQSPPQFMRRNSRNVKKPDYRALAGITDPSSRRKSVSSTSSGPPVQPPVASSSKAKRAVVYSDDEEEYTERRSYSRGRSGDAEDEDEDDFEAEVVSRKSASKKGKGVSSKGGKSKSGRQEEKEIYVRDERKYLPPTTRSPSPSTTQGTKRARAEDDDFAIVDVVSTTTKPTAVEPPPVKEAPIYPAFKKTKFPTMKKNKPPGAASSANAGVSPSTPVSSSRPPLQSAGASEKLPLAVERKKAAAPSNADFDLRDASVYASLFAKPGGTTPNSGFNRKEKEEERRKELNKMREDARAKRLAESQQKTTFNLQAAHEKIFRFEERLHARKSMAIYPNILGAAFKDVYERKRRQAMKEQQR
ncbi:hypothetical protein EIP91_001925 [Steccherinum ochraceum]|uniref:Uncharacterized protein n=1 Tax=Steccherinum ochraceum TaxID=92696 RepID=A0A4R0RJF6_9APHY|nr:hypothetical protein EIP91_001925 [Steccherinum ochraceum]